MTESKPRWHTRTPTHILLIEDSEHDVELIRRALERVGLRYELNVLDDGGQASDYLQQLAQTPVLPCPDLVLLDLSLPRRSGHELLSILKQDDRLRTIPVVILTSSKEHTDVWRSYNLHANAYMVKPDLPDDFVTALSRLAEFYLRVAQLPRRSV